MGLFSMFNRTNSSDMINNLEKAQEILNDKYEKKLITSEFYIKQSQILNKRKEDYLKKTGKSKYDI